MTGTQTRSAQEIRQDVETEARALESAQKMLADLLKGTRKEDGSRQISDLQAEQIRRLNDECKTRTERVNGFKLDYIEARTSEDLKRSGGEPMERPQIWSPAAGQGNGAGEGNGRGAPIKELPELLGQAFVDSPSFKSWTIGGQNQHAYVELPVGGVRELELKATLTTTGLTSYQRPPGAITLGQQELTVADLFSQGTTQAPTIRYLREVSLTNSATTVAEGGLKPEQSWALEEVDAPVRKIAVWTKVTDELFADYPAIRSYINDRLPFIIRQREEFQLLAGDGIAPNIEGVLDVTGILTQARGADTNVDAIYKGITKVRTEGFFEPDAVVIDPTNWTPIRLLKTTTGEYVWGAPSLPGPETIFGKRVVVTVNMTDNTALVGAFKIGGTVFYREGLRVEATNSSDDDFKYNRIMLRAEQREALAIWRAAAFCTVTGLST